MPSYFNFIEGVAGLAAAILRPALSTLNAVRSDMQTTDTELRTQKIGTISLAGRKFSWGAKLSVVNGLLSGITPSITGPSGDEIDVGDAVAATAEAERLLKSLKDFIKEQNLDSSGLVRTKPADDVHAVALKYLTPLAASQLILLNPSVAARTLAGLQAITILLAHQRGENELLLVYLNNFLLAVEALPNFTELKGLYDQIMNSLGGGPFADLAGELASGDLSGLAGQLDAISAISDIAQLGICSASLNISPEIDVGEFNIATLEIPETPDFLDPNFSPELQNEKISK